MLIRSDELIEKNVPLASVAQALARYDFPVPGGPYKRIPFQGFLSPVNSCGYLIGKITASYKDAFAYSNPATSFQLTLGFSLTIAELKAS